jgi:HNH endonuclease
MPVPINPPPSLDRLRELFSYDPETGLFTRITKPPRSKFRAGTVAGWKHSSGYVYMRVDGRVYLAHRLAWFWVYGTWPGEIDHINRNRPDNRIINLRPATPSLNRLNCGPTGRSGVTGVSNAGYRFRPWCARIEVDGKNVVLGYFAEKEQAVAARNAAFQAEMAKHLFKVGEQYPSAFDQPGG